MPIVARAVLPIRSQEDVVRVRQVTRENAVAQGLTASSFSFNAGNGRCEQNQQEGASVPGPWR